MRELLGIEHPILLAPMAGAGTTALAIEVARAGGLGAIACATLSPAQIDDAVASFRAARVGPINLNFFCHREPVDDPAAMAAWRARLAPYYAEVGLDPSTTVSTPVRRPFDDAACAVVERVRPEVVSFHFGLPANAAARARAARPAHA